jgi:hypothetical protein
MFLLYLLGVGVITFIVWRESDTAEWRSTKQPLTIDERACCALLAGVLWPVLIASVVIGALIAWLKAA